MQQQASQGLPPTATAADKVEATQSNTAQLPKKKGTRLRIAGNNPTRVLFVSLCVSFECCWQTVVSGAKLSRDMEAASRVNSHHLQKAQTRAESLDIVGGHHCFPCPVRAVGGE